MSQPAWPARRPAPTRLAWFALAAAAITGACILAIDDRLAVWLDGRATELAPVWRHGLTACEHASGFFISKWFAAGALTGAMVVAALVPRWRGKVPLWQWLALTHLASRVLMGWIKVGTARLRPSEWLERGGASFGVDGGLSFPSGHVVHFASLVVPVLVVAPRLGRALLIVPVFVSLARLAVDAHFASDVIGAWALVAAVAWLASLVVRPLVVR